MKCCSDLSKDTIESIEKRIANYYNDNYLGIGKSGKYVVLHHETTVSGDLCNVVVRYSDNEDSNVYTSVAHVSVNMVTGDCTTKKLVKRTGGRVFIRIIAVLLMLNLVGIPFLGNKFDVWSSADMIRDLKDGSSRDDVPIDVLYYLGGLTCALFIFTGASRESTSTCTFGSLAGIGLMLYVFYQINLGTTIWYVGLHEAHLTFGYYISCVGFISILIASLYKKEG